MDLLLSQALYLTVISLVIPSTVQSEETTDIPQVSTAVSTDTDTTELSPEPESTEQETFFSFPEFDYIDSTKNAVAFKEWEAACSQTPACLGHQPMQKLRCVRKCISPSCYHEIYAFDELEEGEIDIRFQSFKGCFVQRLHKRRL